MLRLELFTLAIIRSGVIRRNRINRSRVLPDHRCLGMQLQQQQVVRSIHGPGRQCPDNSISNRPGIPDHPCLLSNKIKWSVLFIALDVNVQTKNKAEASGQADLSSLSERRQEQMARSINGPGR